MDGNSSRHTDFLVGGGEMGALIRARDWSTTPLGSPETWPPALRTALSICLHSPFPGALYWGPELRMFYNDAWHPIQPDKHPHALGQPGQEVWREVWDVLGPQLSQVLRTGQGLSSLEQNLRMRRDGRFQDTYWNYSFTPIRGEDGTVMGVLSQGYEITAQTVARRDRDAEAARLQDLFRLVPSAIALLRGPGHVFEFANAAYDHITGHRETLGKSVAEALPEVVEQGFVKMLDRTFETGEPLVGSSVAARLQTVPGGPMEDRLLDFVFQPVTDEQGQVNGIFVHASDVTERAHAEIALRQSEERQQLALNAASIGIWDYNPVTDELRWDDRCKALFGLPPDAEITFEGSFVAGLHPDDRERATLAVADALRPDGPGRYDIEYRTIGFEDGIERWIDATGRGIFEDGRAVRFIGTVIDISERKRAEAALAASEAALQRLNHTLEAQVEERTAALARNEARLRAMFETSYQYMGLLATDGTLLEANATSLGGIRAAREDVVGRKFWETPWFSATPGMPEAVEAAIVQVAAGEMARQEIVVDLPTGRRAFDFSMRPMRDEAGAVVAIVPEAVEMTERRNAEQLLRQAQKMEAVGQLTGGIAHDFNNMLAVVMGNLNLVQRRLTKGDADVGKYLEASLEGARRAASLTQRLLAFSRQQPLAPEAIDANRMVAGMSDLLVRSLGENVRVETIVGGGLWTVNADVNQLESVILNLAVNARDAMPDGGKLTIETANVVLQQDYADENDIPAGEYVMIAVSDTGTGMTPEIMAKAFDPFFTTKEVGAGTGLGLSQVFGFVRQSGGHVKIYSEIGHGTTVKVYLPRFDGAAAPVPSKGEDAAVRGGDRRETILVVEDEERVRQYSVNALRELGYSVVQAANGPEALRLIDDGQEITLLFTDIVMPGMTGRQLADAVRDKLRGLKVLYTTGYTRNAIIHGGVLDPGTNFLQKPFSVEQLAAKVRSVLDS